MVLSLSISHEAEAKLKQKAAAAGIDIETYATRVLVHDARRPTLLELSGQVYENFKKTGMTDDELGELLENEKHEERESRRGKPFSE